MHRLLLILAFCFISTVVFAYGAGGYYTIAGVMLDKKTKQPLRNIKFKINRELITTDSLGRFEYKMRWGIACRSGSTRWAAAAVTRKINPRRIFVSYNNVVILIKNKWRKYHYSKKPHNIKLYW